MGNYVLILLFIALLITCTNVFTINNTYSLVNEKKDYDNLNLNSKKISLKDIVILENVNSKMNLTSGQIFKLQLEENPSTGYRWIPSYDGNYFEKISEEYITNSTSPGSPTTHLFIFKALKTGEQNIKMIYKRDFEKTIVNEKVFFIKINP